MIFVFAFVFCLLFIIKCVQIVKYVKSTYYKSTKVPYFVMINDLGRKGEYLIFNELKYLEAKGCKFLFNVYLPKNNDETTEIDVMLIARKGIIVFESKNYSGWIFGNEKYKNWTQTLPQGKGESHKEHFFNPIMQNNLHIKYLKNIIGDEVPIYSIIAFSERCTLKDITVYNKDIQVVKRNDISSAVANVFNHITEPTISDDRIKQIYDILYPYSQVSEEIKQRHIENIKK